MITAGHRQQSGAIGTASQEPDRTVLQLEDDPQEFFGGDQPIPTIPRNDDTPQQPVPRNPETQQRQNGELPGDVFRDPFENENRGQPRGSQEEIPNDFLPDVPEDPEKQEPSEEPNGQDGRNPFVPKPNRDDEIDYQPGRTYDQTKRKSNVYRAPGSDDVLESGNGIYFVPAYDPIPGTRQPTIAPPALMDPHYGSPQQPPWPGQYAGPNQQPSYGHPQYHPQYQNPHPQYQYPQYQQPPAQYGHPQNYGPAPAMQPGQQVYTPVVQPPAQMVCDNRPPAIMTTARRGLLGKVMGDLKNDIGFGDYQSCQNAGNCSGCDSSCSSSCGGACGRGSTCPVFYFGFQAAANDTFDVQNDTGSELVLDNGTAFFFNLGRMNGRNLRTEIELSFRNNDVSSLLTPTGELPVTGQLQTFSGMANAYWEFVNSPTGRFKPYFGGGVGFLSATADLALASDPTLGANDPDSSSSFAYQWMAGVNFKVSNHLDLFGEYRFTDAESFGIPSDRDDLSGDFGYSASSVGGGFRWKF